MIRLAPLAAAVPLPVPAALPTRDRHALLTDVRRGVQLVVGVVLYGIAVAFEVRAGIGLAPWDVLSQGIAQTTGVPFGIVTNILGAAVLLLWVPLRQRAGIGTIVNVLLLGTSAQVALGVITAPTAPLDQAIMFGGGLSLLALATGMYVGARLGPGPRDGLMTGLVARTGRPVWMVRTGIEGAVLVLGALLGGQVGIGTLAFALLVGPMVAATLPLLRVPRAGAESEGPFGPSPRRQRRRPSRASDPAGGRS